MLMGCIAPPGASGVFMCLLDTGLSHTVGQRLGQQMAVAILAVELFHSMVGTAHKDAYSVRNAVRCRPHKVAQAKTESFGCGLLLAQQGNASSVGQ